MTVQQNIAFPLEMRKVPSAARTERVQKVAQLLQIEHLLDRKPRQLSGGQRQRVAIGRALAREPDLYLFDEPLSNLDAQLRLDMRTEIKKLHQRLKSTIVYVTHDQIEAMTLATRIAVMKGGVVQQLGTPHAVYNRPANLFVAGFMGSPRMNLATAQLANRAEECFLEFQKKQAEKITLKLPAQCSYLKPYIGKEVIVGIRPESIRLVNAQQGREQRQHLFEAQINVIEPTGAETLALLDFGGYEFTAKLDPDVALTIGQKYLFSVDLQKMVFYDSDTETIIPV